MAYELPEWFDWADYARLYQAKNRLDKEEWAAQFLARKNGFHPKDRLPVEAFLYDPESPAFSEIHSLGNGRTWVTSNWKNGVLSYGIKGHATHDFIQDTVFELAYVYGGEFFERGQEDLTRCRTTGYNPKKHRSGYFCFPNKESMDKFLLQRTAYSARTMELAINLKAPKQEILDQVAALIDQNWGKPNEANRDDFAKKAMGWSRGLAVYDLKSANVTMYRIKQLVVPLWYGEVPQIGKKPPDNRNKEVREYLAKVSELVNGGWKRLLEIPH